MTLNPERYERVKAILLRIVDLPEAERGAVLEQACGADRELRAEVEALLAHDELRVSSHRSSLSGDSATVATPVPSINAV
jgi:hypothetical protein